MTPDKVQARKMVLVGAFMLAALAVYRDHKGSQRDTFRALWGVGVISLVLSLLADFAPTIAGPFAVLTVLGSLASGDVSIIDRLFGGVKYTNPNTNARGLPSSPTTVPGGTTASGSVNPSRPTAPPGYTPAGGPR